jgi:hypothetical protein
VELQIYNIMKLIVLYIYIYIKGEKLLEYRGDLLDSELITSVHLLPTPATL